MNKSFFTLLFFSICTVSLAQTDKIKSSGGIEFFIHREVTNANGEVEQQLIELWQNYIEEGNFQDINSPYWSFENMKVLMKIFERLV